MKLVLLVFAVVAIFPADSRDFPDKPIKRNFGLRKFVKGGNVEKGRNLRGKGGKGSIKTLIKKLGVMENNLTKANLEMKKELQFIQNHQNNITARLDSLTGGKSKQNMNTELRNITARLDYLEDDNSNQSIKLGSMANNLTQTNSEMNTKFGYIDNKLTKANSDMKIKLQDIHKHQNNITARLDSLEENNLNQEKKLDSILFTIKGGFTIGGQQLTLSTEKVSWLLANERCKSQNASLAVLANPKAFQIYANSKLRGGRVWLGASDRNREGTWTWINGQPLAKFPWPTGEPSDSGGKEDCLEWGWANNYNDADCNSEFRYVCEHGNN